MARLQCDLPTYTAAANGFSIDRGDLGDFTKRNLRWLKRHASKVGAWSEAARMAPNSAGAERVFWLLKTLFDYIRGSIILRAQHPNTEQHQSC
jgi:hypothetical protein